MRRGHHELVPRRHNQPRSRTCGRGNVFDRVQLADFRRVHHIDEPFAPDYVDSSVSRVEEQIVCIADYLNAVGYGSGLCTQCEQARGCAAPNEHPVVARINCHRKIRLRTEMFPFRGDAHFREIDQGHALIVRQVDEEMRAGRRKLK